MRKNRKLIWHIYLSYLIIIVTALLAAAVYISTFLKQFYLQEVQKQLEAQAQLFRVLIKDKVALEFKQEANALCKTFGDQLPSRFTLILRSGVVIGDSMEDPSKMDNHADRPEIQTALSDQIGTSIRYSYTIRQSLMYVAIPIKAGNQIVGVVRASKPVTMIDHALHIIYEKIFLGGLVVAVLAAIFSLFVSYHLNKPLEEMRKGALQFASGHLNHRIYISSSWELGTLAETMNQMASQLHERIEIITQQRNELEAMLTSMVEAVVVVDPEERIVRCNQAASKLFRINAEVVKNRSIQEVIRNPDMQRFVKTTLNSDKPVEDIVVFNPGQEQFLRAHGTLLRARANQIQGALLVFHNITRLKQLENMRREFVANVSHELKTPITSIKGFVETLRDGAINDANNATKFLDIIARNANRLEAIIEDLLLLSKIEQEEDTGQILLIWENVKDVLNSAITVCESNAQEKNVMITLESPDSIYANINPALLEQAVVNLLDNAIKYSESQSTVRVRVAHQGENVVISVEDSGCGISQEHLPRLFERFYRVDKARSRKLGGTGLGLAIVKHIVQAHRGTVTVESTLGKGSTFSITL